jgi:hypothetical protein
MEGRLEWRWREGRTEEMGEKVYSTGTDKHWVTGVHVLEKNRTHCLSMTHHYHSTDEETLQYSIWDMTIYL